MSVNLHSAAGPTQWWGTDFNPSQAGFARELAMVAGAGAKLYDDAFAPMRHLMTEHSEIIGAEGLGIVSRMDGAIDFAEKLLATNPMFSRANPLVGERINKIKDQNRHYLAHEYFNRDRGQGSEVRVKIIKNLFLQIP